MLTNKRKIGRFSNKNEKSYLREFIKKQEIEKYGKFLEHVSDTYNNSSADENDDPYYKISVDEIPRTFGLGKKNKYYITEVDTEEKLGQGARIFLKKGSSGKHYLGHGITLCINDPLPHDSSIAVELGVKDGTYIINVKDDELEVKKKTPWTKYLGLGIVGAAVVGMAGIAYYFGQDQGVKSVDREKVFVEKLMEEYGISKKLADEYIEKYPDLIKQYDSLEKQYDSLEFDLDSTKADLNTTKKDLDSTNADLNTTKAENKELEERMAEINNYLSGDPISLPLWAQLENGLEKLGLDSKDSLYFVGPNGKGVYVIGLGTNKYKPEDIEKAMDFSDKQIDDYERCGKNNKIEILTSGFDLENFYEGKNFTAFWVLEPDNKSFEGEYHKIKLDGYNGEGFISFRDVVSGNKGKILRYTQPLVEKDIPGLSFVLDKITKMLSPSDNYEIDDKWLDKLVCLGDVYFDESETLPYLTMIRDCHGVYHMCMIVPDGACSEAAEIIGYAPAETQKYIDSTCEVVEEETEEDNKKNNPEDHNW